MLKSVAEDPTDPPRRNAQRALLRLAGLSLVSLFAIAIPFDDGSALLGDEPLPPVVEETPGAVELPVGWPGPAPELRTEHESRIWSTVFSQCDRFGIAGDALAMYHVLWEESRLLPHVRSACGRYLGISQFVTRTFSANVAEMKRRGIVDEGARYSPFDPDQAIEVMAFMWSRGYHRHWGPWRRVSRKLARKAGADSPAAVVSALRTERLD